MTRLRPQPTIVLPTDDLPLLAELLRDQATLVDDLQALGRAVEVQRGTPEDLFVPRVRTVR